MSGKINLASSSLRPAVRLDLAKRIDHALASNPANVDALARRASLSRRQLARAVAAQSGESPAAVLRRRRLESAAKELSNGGQSILMIALDAGFQSHEAFTRAFTRHFGIVPSRWRYQAQSLRPTGNAAMRRVFAGAFRRYVEGRSMQGGIKS